MHNRKYIANYTATTPLRPPDWRWRRVCQIVDEGSYATKRYDGETICRAVQYTRGLRRVCSERGVRNLAKRYPDIFLALQVLQEVGLRPLEIKARILARQSDAAIAWRVGLPVPTVTTYVNLFVDVRTRIDARSWITMQVAGLDPRHPTSAQALFLLHAHRRGPSVVEPWIDYLSHLGEPFDLDTEIGRQRAAIDLLVDVHRLPETGSARLSLVKRLDYIVEIQTKSAHDVTVAGAVLQNTHRLLGDFCWAVSPGATAAQVDNMTTPPCEAERQETWETARAG